MATFALSQWAWGCLNSIVCQTVCLDQHQKLYQSTLYRHFARGITESTAGLPSQKACNAEKVSMRFHGVHISCLKYWANCILIICGQSSFDYILLNRLCLVMFIQVLTISLNLTLKQLISSWVSSRRRPLQSQIPASNRNRRYAARRRDFTWTVGYPDGSMTSWDSHMYIMMTTKLHNFLLIYPVRLLMTLAMAIETTVL